MTLRAAACLCSARPDSSRARHSPIPPSRRVSPAALGRLPPPPMAELESASLGSAARGCLGRVQNKSQVRPPTWLCPLGAPPPPSWAAPGQAAGGGHPLASARPHPGQVWAPEFQVRLGSRVLGGAARQGPRGWEGLPGWGGPRRFRRSVQVQPKPPDLSPALPGPCPLSLTSATLPFQTVSQTPC